MNSLKYTHLELGEDVECIAGYYTPLKEVRLKYKEREILYVVGQAVIESSCCGGGNWGYAIVPGYILNWQNSTNDTGLSVSDVEPISVKEIQQHVRKVITDTEIVSNIAFW